MKFLRNVDILRAVRYTSAAAYTVRCLTFGLYHAVVADKESFARLHIVGILLRNRDISLVDTFIIMCKGGGNVNTVGTRYNTDKRCKAQAETAQTHLPHAQETCFRRRCTLREDKVWKDCLEDAPYTSYPKVL